MQEIPLSDLRFEFWENFCTCFLYYHPLSLTNFISWENQPLVRCCDQEIHFRRLPNFNFRRAYLAHGWPSVYRYCQHCCSERWHLRPNAPISYFIYVLLDTFQFQFGFVVTSILIAENAIGKMSWNVLFSHNFFILLFAVEKEEGVGDLRFRFCRVLNMF
jgi:hypothetical protein